MILFLCVDIPKHFNLSSSLLDNKLNIKNIELFYLKDEKGNTHIKFWDPEFQK